MASVASNLSHLSSSVSDVTPQEAWAALAALKDAQLIDVRTQPEWTFSGAPDLTSLQKNTHLISWKFYPTMEVNAEFVAQVSAAIPDKNTPIYFLCKTGGRSLDAALAMMQAGYTQCYNIKDGFEGDRDSHGHRGTLNGWKQSQLPWGQA